MSKFKQFKFFQCQIPVEFTKGANGEGEGLRKGDKRERQGWAGDGGKPPGAESPNNVPENSNMKVLSWKSVGIAPQPGAEAEEHVFPGSKQTARDKK